VGGNPISCADENRDNSNLRVHNIKALSGQHCQQHVKGLYKCCLPPGKPRHKPVQPWEAPSPFDKASKCPRI
jgi:hypothetical protein